MINPKHKKKFADSQDALEGDFNWNYFTAASLQAKNLYLAALIHRDLEKMGTKDIADAVVQGWLGVDVEKNVPSVDHQSYLEMPSDWYGKAPDKQFLKEFQAFLCRDDVAILGGNDNDEAQHELAQYSTTLKLDMFREMGDSVIVCRKDDSGYWTIFNRTNGTKIRLSLDPNQATPTKASAPELVDIKITDYCPFNCAYCYQASTLKGKHASTQSLFNLADLLGDMKVFEVALGGGEPTLHPDFLKILTKFRENGIVPNFTTKSLHWLKDDKYRNEILDVAGNFAYSCENKNDVKNLADLVKQHNINRSAFDGRAVVHYVMGIGTEQNFEEVLNEACNNGLEITLLGYKTNGRGALFNPHKKFDWITIVQKLRENKWLKLGIDTKLAQDYLAQLQAANIPDYMYYVHEGKFSMYIDAVNGLIGPSSYCDDKEQSLLELNGGFNQFDDDVKKVKQHFQSF